MYEEDLRCDTLDMWELDIKEKTPQLQHNPYTCKASVLVACSPQLLTDNVMIKSAQDSEPDKGTSAGRGLRNRKPNKKFSAAAQVQEECRDEREGRKEEDFGRLRPENAAAICGSRLY